MSLVEDKYHDMMAAVHHNDLAAFENQLTRFDDPSNDFHLHRCCYSKTLDNVLHVIAQLGRVDFLNALITKHPNDLDLEIKNADGKTPLHEAAQFSQPGIVLTILGQRQVCVDPIKRGDWTPLMLACTKTGQESLQVVDILIKHGANIALVNKDGWTSFHLAVREGDVAILLLLLQADKSIFNTKSKNGRSPLHTACLHGNLDAVKFILEQTPQPNVPLSCRDSCGATPIMDAVRGGQLSTVSFLADLNQESLHTHDNLGRNCLHTAAHSGHSELVKYLVLMRAMDVKDVSSPTTPLHWGAKEGHAEVVQTLLDLNADPQRLDSHGRTALTLAVGGQHVEASSSLIQHDPLAPFDTKLFALARSEAMKKYLIAFVKQWNIILYLPGVN